jgi:hypothetical protein
MGLIQYSEMLSLYVVQDSLDRSWVTAAELSSAALLSIAGAWLSYRYPTCRCSMP